MKNKLSVLLGQKKESVMYLSEKTGISPTTLYSLYHEKNKNPDTKTIMVLCKYFDITPNDFFGIDRLEDKNYAKN
ncbi:helix-turn-helix domain-containing protein [Staphylococcus pasteuri]|uniref:helix-turn-helix domain-containing protein n=1 Tax=Staphylococcus pasteuri TaxID=45972 RepID=UPI0003C09A0D|nr:helix-turn-helix transcriptional regulator [Staphylococcus pasteuri]AGZ26169.1 putative transcriptional regulator [Staphylococcus pasteuri SP1]